MKKTTLLVIIICLAALTAAAADTPPVVDGLVSPGEYPEVNEDGSTTLNFYSDGEGTLYLAVAAETEGWVAAGLGSDRMDGAHLVMAYRDGGESVIEEHSATGHFHRRSSEQYVLEAAVTEQDGLTVLEFSLPEDAFKDGSTLQLILAYGRRDSLVSRHREYSRITLNF